MFGPARPHWLDQATSPFHLRRKQHSQDARYKLACPPVTIYANAVYYPNYRASLEYPPSSLRLDVISHVFYAFAAISDTGEVYVCDSTAGTKQYLKFSQLDNQEVDCQIPVDGAQGCLQAFAKLKSQYRHLKVILSIGGANGDKVAFANATADDLRRARFASSARNLVDQYSFDGVDSTLDTLAVAANGRS
jgi:chitinase